MTYNKSSEIIKKEEQVIFEALNNLSDSIQGLADIRSELSPSLAKWDTALKEIAADLAGETMFLLLGSFSSGKSTFVNAMLGKELLPTADHPCTSVITELEFVSDNKGNRGFIYYINDNRPGEEKGFEEVINIIDRNRGKFGGIASVHHVKLIYDIGDIDEDSSSPLALLERAKIKIVDSPGFGSPYGLNEAVINEYILKAMYTFWFFQPDRMGGIFETKIISKLKRKTANIIPIIAKSDLISDKEDVLNQFTEIYGDVISVHEPKFISAHKLIEAQKLIINRRVRSEYSTDELEKKSRKLHEESGIESLAQELFTKVAEKHISEAKIRSSLENMKVLLKEILKVTDKEIQFFHKELSDLGWEPSNKYAKIGKIKGNLEKWGERESETIAMRFEEAFYEKIIGVIGKNPSNINANLQKALKDTQETILKPELESMSLKLCESYGVEYEEAIGEKIQFDQPIFTSIMRTLSDPLMAVLQSIRYAGAQSTLTAAGGAFLFLLSKTAVLSWVPFVGTVFGLAGFALIAVAVMPLIPLIMDNHRERREKAKADLKKEIKAWAQSIKIKQTIFNSFKMAIAEIDAHVKSEMDEKYKSPLKKLETAEGIKKEVLRIKGQLENYT